MAIAVTTDWFYERYDRAMEALDNIGRISCGTRSIDYHSSPTGKELVAEFGHFRDVLASMLNTMACDWNAAKVCVTNLKHFDGYLSHIVNNEPTNHMEYGCDALWHSGNVNDTHLIVNGNVTIGYMGGGTYISSEYFDDLGMLSESLNSMRSVIEDYSRIVEEVTSANDFTGLTFDAIKSYMSRVHVPIARSLISVCVTFSSIIRSYITTYNISMRDVDYLYDKDHLVQFKQRIRTSYRELRDKMDEFNCYVSSKNSSHEELELEIIMHYWIDNVELRIDSQLSQVDEIIEAIEENEEAGHRDVAELKGDIDLLDDVVADLGMFSGYRIISRTRQFDSIRPLGSITAREFDIYGVYFGLLLDGTDLQRLRAEEFFRNDIRVNLIESFQGRDTAHYHYNEYRGYDENVLSARINGFNFNDKEFSRRFGSLHSAMIADGYTELRARRFLEIAALFNREGILGFSGDKNDIDGIITKGIQNYVVDYAGYIADSDAYGYNQLERWCNDGEFDCSSLIICAYEKAFIDLRYAMNQTDPTVDEWNYWHIGSNKLSYSPLDKYGFRIFTPNEDIHVNELIPGDIFAIDTKTANHVEMFAGRFESGERVEYLNISAHSSERLSGSEENTNGYADLNGDQLQQWGPEQIRSRFIGTPWSTMIYETTLVREEIGSYNQEGYDVWGHDRIGEIRYENIGPRTEWGHDENHITGCIKWPQYYKVFNENGEEIPEQRDYIRSEEPWNRILRLEDMTYWKTDH
ncbi:LXG domain of WXG superfamily protein [Oscillospiraceae bacterium]|nr:LXG domain of WXG superfamily protein [Oscillospiraceae bacterium]